MGKKKKIVNNKDKIVKSVNKNLRSSTRKLKPILRAIVGKKVDIAIRNLSFSEKRITHDIKKTISSAIANAENNYQYDIDKLFIKEAYCGKQIVMKCLGSQSKKTPPKSKRNFINYSFKKIPIYLLLPYNAYIHQKKFPINNLLLV